MKRSDAIALVLMGVSFVTWTAFAKRDDQLRATGFNDVGDCAANGFSQTTCRDAYAQAFRQHEARAPRYATAVACQSATDTTCTPVAVSGGGSPIFKPAMTGFMVTQCDPSRTDCSTGGSGGAFGGGAPLRRAEPLYESRAQGGYRELSAFRGGAATTLGPPTVQSVSVSRGGFGGFRGFSGRG